MAVSSGACVCTPITAHCHRHMHMHGAVHNWVGSILAWRRWVRHATRAKLPLTILQLWASSLPQATNLPLSHSLSRTKKGERGIRTGKDSYSKSTIMLLGSCAQLRHSTWLQAGWFTVQHKSVYGLKLRHQYGDVNTSSSECAQWDGGAMMPCTSSDSPSPHPQLHPFLSHT